MRKRGLVAMTTAAAAMVVLAGGLMASNMGFKLNYPLKKQAGGVSKTGNQTISIPYNPQVGMTMVSHLFADITLAGPVQNVSKFLPATDTYQPYTFAAQDFALQAGVGLFVKAGGDFSYIIVGSHDPSAVVQLKKAGAGSLTGNNLLAPPYHTTAANASDLFKEIGLAQSISKFVPLTDTFTPYTFASPDFPIVPGVAYFVKMGSDLAYQPSHY